MTSQKPTTKNWMKLDNMANLFPAIELFSAAPIYRVSVTLDRNIDGGILKNAVIDILKRFPYYKVRLKKGLFWLYLEHNPKDPAVTHDGLHPCVGINYKENNDYLFKIKYIDNIIAIEIFHALTDGGGAMIFLKTLTARYLTLCGENIAVNKDMGIWDINEEVPPEEAVDSFYKYYNKNIKSLGIKSPAYHYRGTKEKQDVINVIKATISGSEFAKCAKKYGLSVTELLTSVYLYSLMNLQKKTGNRRPIRISVPVNLRHIFPSNTMRNFTNFVLCGISPQSGDYTFEDIAVEVFHSMRRGVLKNNILKSFSGNVSSEKKIIVRILPLRLKMIMLSLIYAFRGENQYSGSMSNLGVVKFPADMENFINEVSCYLAPNSINPTNCGAVCYKDKLIITFTRTIKESHLEKEFFSFLVKQGLKVNIKSSI